MECGSEREAGESAEEEGGDDFGSAEEDGGGGEGEGEGAGVGRGGIGGRWGVYRLEWYVQYQ